MLRLVKKVWFKVALFALLAIASALLAVAFRNYIPDDIGYSIDAKTIENILAILASSMLTVTTFSLAVMVSPTPRRRRPYRRDRPNWWCRTTPPTTW